MVLKKEHTTKREENQKEQQKEDQEVPLGDASEVNKQQAEGGREAEFNPETAHRDRTSKSGFNAKNKNKPVMPMNPLFGSYYQSLTIWSAPWNMRNPSPIGKALLRD